MPAIVMKLTKVGDENLLAATELRLLNKTFRERNLHITVTENFYGTMRVSIDVFRSALRICTIANLVGKTVTDEAIKLGMIDPENIITIDGVPYAQYAKITN
jgi:hypothetical protein